MTNFSYSSERSYITNELSDMLSQLCQEKNLSFALTKTRYTNSELKITVELSPKDSEVTTGVNASNDPDLAYRNAWKRQAHRYRSLGLKSEWLGKTIKFGHSEYTIVGLAQRKQRCPIIVRGKSHDITRKISVEAVVERSNIGEVK